MISALEARNLAQSEDGIEKWLGTIDQAIRDAAVTKSWVQVNFPAYDMSEANANAIVRRLRRKDFEVEHFALAICGVRSWIFKIDWK
jgi:hypothetical protein